MIAGIWGLLKEGTPEGGVQKVIAEQEASGQSSLDLVQRARVCWWGVGGGLAFSTPLSDFGCWRMGVVTSLARRLLSGKGNSPHKRTAGVAARPWSHPPQQLEDGCSSLTERPGPGGGGGHGGGQYWHLL